MKLQHRLCFLLSQVFFFGLFSAFLLDAIIKNRTGLAIMDVGILLLNGCLAISNTFIISDELEKKS